MDTLVTTEWLASQLGKPGLVVCDATYYLPTEKKDARALFRQARIPGARFFDIEEIGDPDSALPHMVPAAGRFEKLVSALGIGNGDRVVFYDQKGLQSAGRGWWMMGLFGHDEAAVLDGGLPKWLREGRPSEAGEPPPPPPATFRATLRAGRLRGIGDMMQPEGEQVVLDARSAGRFHGTDPEPRPGLPSGHIPGSRSVPSTSLLAADGTMLPAERLRDIFAAVGADGGKPIVTTCGTGVSATVVTLALVRAGLPRGAVYDGSWTEWASRPDTKKETT